MATNAQRAHLKAVMKYLVDHQARVHYDQIRPMTTRNLLEQPCVTLFGKGGSIIMDCSEAVTLLCRWAGLADPNGLNYNGYGYTGTLLDHLPHYTNANDANVGGLVVFGPHPGHHVCMVYTPGSDPMLFSHGREGAPEFIRLSAEKAKQPAPTVFLNVSKL